MNGNTETTKKSHPVSVVSSLLRLGKNQAWTTQQRQGAKQYQLDTADG